MDDHSHSAGAVHDLAWLGPILWWPSAYKKYPLRARAVFCHGSGHEHPLGNLWLQPSLRHRRRHELGDWRSE